MSAAAWVRWGVPAGELPATTGGGGGGGRRSPEPRPRHRPAGAQTSAPSVPWAGPGWGSGGAGLCSRSHAGSGVGTTPRGRAPSLPSAGCGSPPAGRSAGWVAWPGAPGRWSWVQSCTAVVTMTAVGCKGCNAPPLWGSWSSHCPRYQRAGSGCWSTARCCWARRACSIHRPRPLCQSLCQCTHSVHTGYPASCWTDPSFLAAWWRQWAPAAAEHSCPCQTGRRCRRGPTTGTGPGHPLAQTEAGPLCRSQYPATTQSTCTHWFRQI